MKPVCSLPVSHPRPDITYVPGSQNLLQQPMEILLLGVEVPLVLRLEAQLPIFDHLRVKVSILKEPRYNIHTSVSKYLTCAENVVNSTKLRHIILGAGGGDNLCVCGAYSPVGETANKQVNR